VISPHISIQKKISNFHILKNFEIWKFARVGNTDICNLPQQEGRLFHCRFVLLWNLCSKLHQMWKFLVRQLDRWHWLLNIEKVLGPWKHRAAKNCVNNKSFTLLQKLSKCEVKAWRCWNLIILLPLRIYVKSNFVNSNRPKMLFLAILDVLNFDFSKFEQLSSPKLPKNSKFNL